YGPPGLQFLRPAGRRYSAGSRNWLSILRIYPLIHYSIQPRERDLRSSTIRYVSQDRNSAQPQGAGTAASVAPIVMELTRPSAAIGASSPPRREAAAPIMYRRASTIVSTTRLERLTGAPTFRMSTVDFAPGAASRRLTFATARRAASRPARSAAQD